MYVHAIPRGIGLLYTFLQSLKINNNSQNLKSMNIMCAYIHMFIYFFQRS